MSNEENIKIERKYPKDPEGSTKSLFGDKKIKNTLSGQKKDTAGKITEQGGSSGIYEFTNETKTKTYIIKLFKPYSEKGCIFNPDHYFKIIEFAKYHKELISILEAGNITIDETDDDIGFTQKIKYIYMIMEKGTPLTPKMLNKYKLKKILSNIVSLHKEGIKHNDLKLDNIVTTKDDEIKFIDFEETITTTDNNCEGEKAWIHCKKNDDSIRGCPNQADDRRQFYRIYLTFINKGEQIDVETLKESEELKELEELEKKDIYAFNEHMIELIDQAKPPEILLGKKIRKSKKNKQNKNRIKSKKLRLFKKNKSKKRKIKRSNKFKI